MPHAESAGGIPVQRGRAAGDGSDRKPEAADGPGTAELRCGVDVVALPRFEAALQRGGARLLRRLFRPSELATTGGQAARLAACYAAKEAVVKALGGGFGPVAPSDVEIRLGSDPSVRLHARAAGRAADVGVTWCEVRAVCTQGTALAVAVAGTGDPRDNR